MPEPIFVDDDPPPGYPSRYLSFDMAEAARSGTKILSDTGEFETREQGRPVPHPISSPAEEKPCPR